ncbi:MAG: hypothetical protein WAT20_15820 [Ferruginibacter sp.]|nr:hypothetical protein [Chitinophagaceae bacterium]
MQQYIFQLMTFTFFLIQPAKAQQPFQQLDSLKNEKTKVYYSAGYSKRAATIKNRVDKAMVFYQKMLEFTPEVTLLVLSADDWKKYTPLPVVYGMPHFNAGNKTLVVAAADNPFWKSFIPPVDQLPEELREKIQGAYKTADDHLSMQPFFDLLALHEVGHAFHTQAGLTMQRNWMGELFVNILLHTYIAEKEPEALPALTVFPQMVVTGGIAGFKFTSLKDVHERYDEIASKYPNNYGWYQCRWHAASATIYNIGGKLVGRKVWDALKGEKENLTDDQLLLFLETAADKTVAAVMRNWEKETRK